MWTAPDERLGALLMLGFAVVAIAPPAALALVSDTVLGGRGDYFIYRNVIVATVPLTIAAATVVATPRAGRLGVAVVVVACVLLTAVSVEIARRPDLQRPDIRAVATATQTSPERRAIVADIRTAEVLKLYLTEAVDALRPAPRSVRWTSLPNRGALSRRCHRTAFSVSAPNESTRLPSFASGHRGAGR
jgi:hypothetical protein